MAFNDISQKKCFCCGTKSLRVVKIFLKSPESEPNYKIKNYYRKLIKCKGCGHFKNESKVNMSKIYENDYSVVSYGDNLWGRLLKIYRLNKKSDNFHRVKRILKKYKKYTKSKNFNVLDVGAGFGLFLYALKKKNNLWKYLAVEPNIANVKFILKKLRINTIKEFIEKFSTNKKFNLVTLNKVLEHTKKPIVNLKKLKKYLKKNGQIYVEIPDGTSASKIGYSREEFFIDHFHIFSKKSLTYVIRKAGFNIIQLKKIKEPSGKYTIFAFIKSKD